MSLIYTVYILNIQEDPAKKTEPPRFIYKPIRCEIHFVLFFFHFPLFDAFFFCFFLFNKEGKLRWNCITYKWYLEYNVN